GYFGRGGTRYHSLPRDAHSPADDALSGCSTCQGYIRRLSNNLTRRPPFGPRGYGRRQDISFGPPTRFACRPTARADTKGGSGPPVLVARQPLAGILRARQAQEGGSFRRGSASSLQRCPAASRWLVESQWNHPLWRRDAGASVPRIGRRRGACARDHTGTWHG